MTTEQLQKYKEIYTDIQIPQHLIEEKWRVQQDLLPAQDTTSSYYRFMPYGAAFLSVCLLISVATLGFAQSAKPGSILYPVKAVTKNISTKLTNTFHPDEEATPPVKMHKTTNFYRTATPAVPTPTNKPTPTSIEKAETESFSSNSDEHKQSTQDHPTELHTSTEITSTPPQNSSHGNSDNTQTFSSNNSDVKGASTENDHANNSNNNNNASNEKSDNGDHGDNKK